MRGTCTILTFGLGVLIFMSASAVSSAAPTLLRGPYLQSCSQTSIVVRWRTDQQGYGMVRFGTNTMFSQDNTESSSTTEHAVLLMGLTPGTRYFYSIGDAANTLASGSDYFFFTAPAQPKPTRIWAIGDSGTGPGNAYAVRDAYLDYTGARYTAGWM